MSFSNNALPTTCSARVRAGLLESGTCDLLREAGVGARLDREGLVHDGTFISFNGEPLHIDFKALIGKQVTVYGQTEVTKDLMDARVTDGASSLYEADVTAIDGLDGDRARLHFTHAGTAKPSNVIGLQVATAFMASPGGQSQHPS